MAVRPILSLGDPILRQRARGLSLDELASPDIQTLIDDLIDTKRAAHGAGLAANQVGETVRVAVVEVEPNNPRYPYKPTVPLTVIVNPEIVTLGDETFTVNEGCLSIPGLRGELERHLEIRVSFLDRDGHERTEVRRGLTAGTFQHELDHLDGVLFVDRADPRTLATPEEYERHQLADFERRARALVDRVGS